MSMMCPMSARDASKLLAQLLRSRATRQTPMQAFRDEEKNSTGYLLCREKRRVVITVCAHKSAVIAQSESESESESKKQEKS